MQPELHDERLLGLMTSLGGIIMLPLCVSAWLILVSGYYGIFSSGVIDLGDVMLFCLWQMWDKSE